MLSYCLECKTIQCSALFGMQVYTSVGWVTQCLFRLPVFSPQVTLSVILLTSDEQNLRTNDPKSFKSNSLTKLSNLLKTAIYQTLPRINGNLKRCWWGFLFVFFSFLFLRGDREKCYKVTTLTVLSFRSLTDLEKTARNGISSRYGNENNKTKDTAWQ